MDSNHADVAAFFRAHGCEVESLARLGNGVPDLLVSKHGKLALIEVKHGKGQRTTDQAKFCIRFPVWVVRTNEDAEDVLRWIG